MTQRDEMFTDFAGHGVDEHSHVTRVYGRELHTGNGMTIQVFLRTQEVTHTQGGQRKVGRLATLQAGRSSCQIDANRENCRIVGPYVPRYFIPSSLFLDQSHARILWYYW